MNEINPARPREDKGLLSGLKENRQELIDFIQYTSLKIRERFGRLDKEGFERLLAFDFQRELQDNPSNIEGEFSPEGELQRIKKLPRREKRRALPAFKERLATQRLAWAACEVFIERQIEFDHDVPKDKLMETVDLFGRHYGFTEEQRDLAERIVDRYYEARGKVLALREEFPDDRELLTSLTGVKFGESDKVKVSIGPMSIDVEADSRSAGKIYELSEDPVHVYRGAGFMGTSSDGREITLVVFNTSKPSRWILLDPFGTRAKRHEYQHAKNRLFEKFFGKEKGVAFRGLFEDYDQEADPRVKEVILEDFFRHHRAKALDDARDEILAGLTEKSPWAIDFEIDAYYLGGSGPYDYLKEIRDDKNRKSDRLYQKVAKQVLRKEYGRILHQAVRAVGELSFERKLSKQEIVALFIDKPLTLWPKVARRFLGKK